MGVSLGQGCEGVNNQSRQALLGAAAKTAHYKPGQEPREKALEFELREHAGRQMAAQDAQVRLAPNNVEETGAFREYIGRDDRRKRGHTKLLRGSRYVGKCARKQCH